MSRRHAAMLLALGSIWGASFLLLKIALRDLAPESVVAFRIAIAGTTLVVLLPLIGGRSVLRALRSRWRAIVVVAAFNSAIPFFLLTWGQQYLDTGVAAVFNASAPLWTALLALGFVHSERVTGWRLLGFLLGFGGIVLLIGFEPSGGPRAVAGSLAVCAAAALYSASALFTGRRLAGVSPSAIALGSMLWAIPMTLPAGLVALRGREVGWETVLALLALGAVATGLAYLLYFGLIAGAGASRAILVTYLVPSLALLYGALLLDEPVTAQGLTGLALVLAGVALGTGGVRFRRVRPAL